ncbi:hypothetical protein A5893_01750 [Pedobacter psychrophilus]|uniref:DUF5777 domain-containing protein n=1 Tax=Pedobacter psychrophilus TaxID=1826909 RepID=A0A179DL98_9SPHI|nr:DUF5777 family beta-barrel protein [Pedobacter psychrophilus]OAQ41867.1 hypothetical protein A5893_01750 [Pedobacter psychrophilus]
MRLTFFTILLICSFQSSYSQDADSILNSLTPQKLNEPVLATFKSTHLVLLNTNETQRKNDLAFWISHRFGDIGGQFGGAKTLFGLDLAPDVYIGFDYGFTDKLTIGIGRSKVDATYNLLAKYRLIQQKENSIPFSLTLFAQTAIISRAAFNSNEFPNKSDRTSHFLSSIFTSKVSQNFSLLISPSVLLRSKTTQANDPNSLFSIGFGGRLKLYKRFSLIADYILVEGLGRSNDLATSFYNPLGAGIEIETGGHIFSLNFQNSSYIIENNFIPNTQKSWRDGGVRWGFAVSRNFALFQKKNKNKDIETKIY